MSTSLAIRGALAQLPRAANIQPGDSVDQEDVYTVATHRSALDPSRPLVVGNRGMGKSFWAHALLDTKIRARAADDFQFPSLKTTDVIFGFNGSSRTDAVAPPPQVLDSASGLASPVNLWRAVLAGAAFRELNQAPPSSFAELVSFTEQNAERYARLLTQADDALQHKGRRLLVLFDALDRLSHDWGKTRSMLQGLLQLALSVQSFRAIRIKLFLRLDQFADRRLFEFPDASKIQNTHVKLEWSADDLYGLLFHRLRRLAEFRELETRSAGSSEAIVSALAGEFMGATKKRGVVFTWLPTHLADALRQISPRTFLTAWRVAAEHGRPPENTPVDHAGILDGVRHASQDRLAELSEDYPWVRAALSPLRNQFVPIERPMLEKLWERDATVATVREIASTTDRRVTDSIVNAESSQSDLLGALAAIGVVAVRQNGKIDVPDIFRVEAGIKRRGGVPAPKRQE